jgi:hypothetical protein
MSAPASRRVAGYYDFVVLEFLGEINVGDVMHLSFLMTSRQFGDFFAHRYLEFDSIRVKRWASCSPMCLEILRPRVYDYCTDIYKGKQVFRMVLVCDGWAGTWPKDLAMWPGK